MGLEFCQLRFFCDLLYNSLKGKAVRAQSLRAKQELAIQLFVRFQ